MNTINRLLFLKATLSNIYNAKDIGSCHLKGVIMGSIKYGCQTYPWKVNFEKFKGRMPHIAKVAAEAGYQGLEAEICMLGDYFYKPEELAELLNDNNLTFAAIVLHQDWEHEKETEEEAELSRQTIEFIKHFPFAKIMTSHHAGAIERGTGEELYQRRKNLISCMNSVCNRAAEEGIVTAFHPNSAKNSLFRTEEDYKVLFDFLYKTDIGYIPDIGHIANGGMDPLEILKQSRDKIRHVHFKDRIAQNEWALMGEGKIDYPEIVRYLEETDYNGWIMVEDESPKAIEDSDFVVIQDGKYISRFKK